MTTLELRGAHLVYPSTPPVHALRGLDVRIGPGELVAVDGPSGGGKSTLLHVLGLLDVPTDGVYLVDGADAGDQDERARAERRSTTFAFVFQSFHLLEHRPVLDSVELGLVYRAVPPGERRRRALRALDEVGLGDRWHQDASTLSGGQRQRVAIARALACAAPVVLADEPTGNLDSENGAAVLAALRALHAAGTTIVVVTHDPDVAAQTDRRLTIRDGVCVADSGRGGPALPVVPPGPLGRASRLRARDLVRDAVASTRSRRGRSAGLALAVAVGVVLAVGTAGLATSASAQVAATFDARENRYVTLTTEPSPFGAPVVTGRPDRDAPAVEAQLAGLAGVEAASVVTELDQQPVAVAPGRAGQPVATLSATSGLVRSAEATVTWAGPEHRLAAGQVLVGRQLADNLGLGPLVASPALFVAGRPFVVAGVVDDGGRLPELVGALVVDTADSPALGFPGRRTALVLTRAGAAQQVARQALLVVDPVAPESVVVQAPTDPRDLRASIESDVSTVLAVLTGIALLASVVGLANAMSSAVVARRQEIGLRRAVGCRPRHVVALVLGESTLIGAAGGVVGLALGLAAILAVTIAQRWTPVLDLRLAPVALVGGIVVGTLGGAVAAVRASRIQPSEALRQ